MANGEASPERRRKLLALHQAAAGLDAAGRTAFLDRACDGDPSLRDEVLALLQADVPTAAAAASGAGLVTSTLGTLDIAPPALDRQRVGSYRLIQSIGSGGMGAVYLAVRDDDQYRKRVAVKLLRRDSVSEELRRRFRRERQILASLDHDNIARLLDGGTTEDESPYLVMEYVEGMPVDQYCDAHGLSIRERLELFRPICSAVHFAHQNLVVHRDLKPGNILVTAKGVPKLLDFGIAKLLNPELAAQAFLATRLDARMMTPEYASPEQIRGEPITTAADIYALGVLLYELLTGHRPYRLTSRNLTEIARVICEEQPTRPSTVIAKEADGWGLDGATRRLTPDSVSRTREGSPEKLRRRLVGDLDNIVLMAMRKEPQRRYTSAEQLADDIRRHLEGQPVIARKDTLGYRTERFAARHRMGVAAAALVLLALVGGIVATTWQARMARAERARAEAALADVRKLANTFIFDVHDAIEKLPGSTPARQMVVKGALEYLDRLARDAPRDAALQLELAAAYARIGTLQWNRYLAHVGQLTGALQSQRKALVIREAVSHADPGNPAARQGLGHSHLLIGDILAEKGDLAGALESYRRSLKVRQEIVTADPRDVEARKNLSATHQRIGDTLGNPGFPNLGDAAGALESFDRMQAIVEGLAAENPTDLDLRNRLAIGLEKRGKVLAGRGEARALSLFQKEVEALQELCRAAPTNAEYRRNLGVAYGNVGDAFRHLNGDLDAARAAYGKALAVREELAAADPTNRGAQRDVALAHAALAGALREKGDHRGANDAYGKAASTYEGILAADPAQSGVRALLATTLESQAAVSMRLGRSVEARAQAGRSLSFRREQASRAEATAEDLNGFAWQLLTVEPASLRDAAAALPHARRAVEMTNGQDPNILDTLAHAYHATGDQARAVETAERAIALLDGESAQRRELEANLARFGAAQARARRPATRSAPPGR